MIRTRTPGHTAEALRELLGDPGRSRAAQGAGSAADAFEWVVPAASRAESRV